MEYKEESKKDNYPDCISLDCTEKIIEQMKLKVCKIILEKGNGTGFFCKIKFPNNRIIPVLITNNHIINESILENENNKIYYSIYNQKNLKYIKLNNRMKYTNKKYDITIIEIKENIDDNMYFDIELNNNNIKYYKKSIYVLHYPNEKDISVSYGILSKMYEDKEYEFQHYCTTYKGSSGSPILDILNNKIIGIHKGAIEEKYNLGTFINYPINEFIGINDNIINENYNIKNLLEKEKRITIIDKDKTNFIKEQKRDEKINELKKKIELLNLRIEYYKNREKELISYYEKMLSEKILSNNKLEISEIKNDKYNNKVNKDNLIRTEDINHKENKEKKKLKEIEFINNNCNICHNKVEKKIYKCPYDYDYFLCEKCYNNNRKKSVHEHLDFFEIIFPKYIIKMIEEKEKENKLYNIVNDFYRLLKLIFFDKNGDLLISSSINNFEIKNLKNICIAMNTCKADLFEYFSLYQKTFINSQLNKMDEKSKALIIKKITQFSYINFKF